MLYPVDQLFNSYGVTMGWSSPKPRLAPRTIRLLKGVGRDSVDKAPGDADREDREDLQAV